VSADTRRTWAVLCVVVLYVIMLLPHTTPRVGDDVQAFPLSVPSLPECSP
jgi:hypothetical protein